MSLFAVQNYAKDVLDGVNSPGWTQPLLAAVVVPNPDVLKLGQPRLFIWGAAATERRTAIPRSAPGVNTTLPTANGMVNAGWKQRSYTISMWLYGAELPNDPNQEFKFPVLIEQVLDTIRMTSQPVNLQDPQTGEQSQLQDFGEEFAWEYDVDRTLADQRTLLNLCRIDVTCLENQQF